MLKLIQYLKPYRWLIVAIVGLLFGQAMADLTLPSYMANIVNVGIQQGGIETAVPEAVRASEFNKLTLFMTDSEKAQVTKDYTLLDKATLSPADYATYVKDYPQLATTPIYKLNTNDSAQITKLDSIFSFYIPAVFTIETQGTSIFAGTPLQIPSGVDPFTILAQLSPDQLNTIRSYISAQTSSMPKDLLKPYSIAYVSAEYKAIGMDVGNIQTHYMLRVGLFMLLLTLASAASSVAVGFLSARIAAGLGRDLRRKLFGRVESFSNTEFDKFSTASLVTRSTNDITQIQMVMVMLLRFVFYAPILAVGGIIKVVNTDTSLLWVIGLAVGVVLTIMVIAFIVVLPKFRAMQNLTDKLNLVTRQILSGLMVIRAFNTQKHEEAKFDVANKDLTKVSLFINHAMVLLMPVMMFIMNGVMLLIVWFGAHQVDAGTMQVGDMMAFIQYAVLIIFSFLMISIVFIMLPRASVSAGRISEVIETEPVIKDPMKPEPFKGDIFGLVEFQDVSFRYPGAEEDVLKHISFTAKPGQTTAFIGSTGSGKSTLVNLVMRFYDVIGGRVLIDGLDVRNVSQHDLRDKIGYVPQKAVLFSGTIESNIKYGNGNTSNEDVAKYIDIAQATDFVSANDGGLAVAVSQGGTNFSGGQKQRISIARALAKKPEVYIFDDSLSALDFKTDATLRKALKKETSNATVMIVTQRVGTIMGADQIVVLDDGMIVGKGTHKELMSNCSVYQEIASSQLSKEELAQ